MFSSVIIMTGFHLNILSWLAKSREGPSVTNELFSTSGLDAYQTVGNGSARQHANSM